MHYTNTPYWVLLAFSIELMLKSLYVKHTYTVAKQGIKKVQNVKIEHLKGHILDDVFEQLPEKIKHTLVTEFSDKYKLNLQDILNEHSTLFDEARYVYPRNGHIEFPAGFIVNESNLYAVADFLNEWIPVNQMQT